MTQEQPVRPLTVTPLDWGHLMLVQTELVDVTTGAWTCKLCQHMTTGDTDTVAEDTLTHLEVVHGARRVTPVIPL